MASLNLPTREVLVFAYVVIVFPTAIEGSWKQQVPHNATVNQALYNSGGIYFTHSAGLPYQQWSNKGFSIVIWSRDMGSESVQL